MPRSPYSDAGRGDYSFLAIPHPYFHFLTGPEATLLALLRDQFRFRKETGELRRDYFFPCSHAMTRQKIGGGAHPYERIFRQLKEKGLIQVKMIGNPAKRHVRINFEKVQEQCVKSCSGVDERRRQEGSTNVEGSLLLRNKVKELSHSLRDVRSNGFFESANGEIEQIDQDLADRLFHELKKSKLLTPRSKKTTWPDQFRILRGDYPLDQIRQVFDWYIAHLKDTYTPHARSAGSFRRKFLQIKEAMERDHGPSLEICDDVKSIVRRLKEELQWQGIEVAELEICCQLSWDSIRTFCLAIRRLRRSEDGEVAFFANDWYLSEPEFVVEHMHRVHSRLCDGWGGPLHQMAFKLTDRFIAGQLRAASKRVRQHVMEQVNAYREASGK